MKIGVNDNCGGKFSSLLTDHWRNKGHEVRFELGANPEFGEWADLIFVDFFDNNAHYYYRNNIPKKKLAVRGIDIELWCERRYMDGAIFDYLDHLITISQPMYAKVLKEQPLSAPKLALIKPGVDMSKFTFKVTPTLGYNVCMVVGNMWELKNTLEGFRIFQLLVKRTPQLPWRLHIRGEMPQGERELEVVMRNHALHANFASERIQVYDRVDDLNAWYEQMDFIITPSLKEAFSYATAEAMAKGIKPIINNWWGAPTIWDEKYIYYDLDQAVEMILSGDYHPEEYRHYIQDHYDAKRMLAEFDQLLGT